MLLWLIELLPSSAFCFFHFMLLLSFLFSNSYSSYSSLSSGLAQDGLKCGARWGRTLQLVTAQRHSVLHTQSVASLG